MTAVCADVPYRQQTPSRRRSNSGEIDVFDAVNYFLGDERGCHASSNSWKNFSAAPRKTNVQSTVNGASLTSEPHLPHKQPRSGSDQNKLCKTPSSPGTKLAGFLNSLFASSTASKKKQKPAAMVSTKGCSENPIETRKRRNSMPNLRQSVCVNSPKSLSSSSSGIETPSSLSSNGRASDKEFNGVINARSDFHWKSFPTNRRSLTLLPMNRILDGKNSLNVAWLEQNFIVSDVSSAKNDAENQEIKREKECPSDAGDREKNKERRKESNLGASVEREGVGSDDFTQKKSPYWKKTEEVDDDDDDGFESDSSSDLFELENYDLHSHFPNDLPVHGITRLQNNN